MKRNLLRILSALLLGVLVVATAGCESDFYLSESEATAYANLFSSESTANNFLSLSLPNQVLDIQFNNSSPPSITSTNLVSLMRNYSTLGLVEAITPQTRPERLNTELQTQIERYIRKKLQVYSGLSNAGVKLTRLTSVGITFRNQPSFAFHPDRQAISYSLRVTLVINATIQVDALDPVTNFLFGVNGTYPLRVTINDLDLNGDATLLTPFADASEIAFSLVPHVGSVVVTDTGSPASPAVVKKGVRDLVRDQLSEPLTQNFVQRYTYFSLSGLRLNADGTLSYGYRPRPATAALMIHMVARAADGKLYHLRKLEGGSSVMATVKPFPNLQNSIQNEPALIASGTDQLEVAATTTAGELVYAHWRDDTWTNQMTFAPASSAPTAGYTGKPAMVASAPGQVEMIAVGRNGGLFHARRLNGLRYNATGISLPDVANVRTAPFRDPTAVQVGNKVVVVFVDSGNRLQSVVFDMESGIWGPATNISTSQSVSYAPTAVASSDGRVDVVYVGPTGTPFHRVLDVQSAKFLPNGNQSGITIVGNETNIGGTLTASPVLLCSSFKQLELIGRGTDNKLWYAHLTGPNSPWGWVDGRWILQGWSGWGDVNGHFAGNATIVQGAMGSFAASSTRTGKLVTASIIQQSLLDNHQDQKLYYNTFDSERYAVQPWKTVIWRGHELAGQQRFLGQPAVAAMDRNFALAYIDSNFNARRARLSDLNDTSFVGIDNNTQVNSSAPVDPVTVSSVAGLSDTILVGGDGRIRHIRRGDRVANTTTTILIAPAGVTFTAEPAVVGYGGGQLEVVAVSQTGSLYHWRFQNGIWSGATQLSGSSLSPPALVNLGGGQLATLAIGSNQHLYLWYFSNGTWANARQINSTFLINPVLFGPLSVSSWGEGCIDLAVVEAGTGALYDSRLGAALITAAPFWITGMTPGFTFGSLGGNWIDTPIVTALSATRISILGVGTDHVVYSRWSWPDPSSRVIIGAAPAILWDGYENLGGLNLLLGGVAKTGANELTAVGLDTNGHVFLSRFNGGKWNQYQPVQGQNTQTQLSPPLFRPTVSVLQ